MSHAQPVVPGATYLLTRRCYQRAFRLTPTDLTTQIVTYCLALALRKFGVLLHAACVMSNHMHLVITDPNGVLPDFQRELHRFIAKAMNALHGSADNFWSSEKPKSIRLADPREIIDKIAYVAANPVAAGLVESPEKWPGLVLWKEDAVHVERPMAYFGKRSTCPDALDLVISPPPPNVSEASTSSWMEDVRSALMEHVAEAHRMMRELGRRFLGRAAVLATSFKDRAKSYEAKRTLVPSVSATDKAARLALLAVRKAFRIAYRAALNAWQAGDREVVFPYGTWWMRVHHNARCAPAPLSG